MPRSNTGVILTRSESPSAVFVYFSHNFFPFEKYPKLLITIVYEEKLLFAERDRRRRK